MSREPIIVDNYLKYKAFQVHAEAKIGAIDIETTIVDNPWQTPPELVSVAVTFDGLNAFVFRNDEFLKHAKVILEYRKWIMHNGLFDRLILKAFFSIDVPLTHDTMAMQYLLDPDEKKSLEFLSEAVLGLPAYKDVDYRHILDEPFEKVAKMNGEDVLRTFNLFRPLADRLNKDKQLSRVYQWLLMPALSTYIDITLNGIPLNRERLAKVTHKYEQEVKELLAKLRDATPLPGEDKYAQGWPKPSGWRVNDKVVDGVVIVKGQGKFIPPGTFNPSSPNEVKHILFDLWGLPPLEYTKDKAGNETSNPSTNADVLLRLETFHTVDSKQEWLSLLRTYRKSTKLLSYFTSWPNLVDSKGWLHPRYKPLHAVTGRRSSDSPNIQQVPRKQVVRSVFGSPDYDWYKADYSQIELRLAALAAQEPTMLEAYRTGEDIHRLTAKLVLQDTSDEARQVGKTLNFALVYSAGPATLQRVARNDYGVFLSRGEAEQYRTNFFLAYPGLQFWHERLSQQIERTGESRSPFGRVRYLPNAKIPRSVKDMRSKKYAAIREGINHQVQSFAADLMMGATLRLAPVVTKLGGTLVAEVHDEVDIVMPKGLEDISSEIRDVMEDLSWLGRFGIKLDIPLLVAVTKGPDWGHVE